MPPTGQKKDDDDTSYADGGSSTSRDHVDEAQVATAFNSFISAAVTYLSPGIAPGDLDTMLAQLQDAGGADAVVKLQEVLQTAEDAVVSRAKTDKRLTSLASTVEDIRAIGNSLWPCPFVYDQ